ncbi:hypothetical protein G7Z17_g1470 [Cylindrodendrum hubeiense]|uniref:Uncharacterized protein n=1 Tax=Cylindrodendrum hubeiense TaxID=595255 RepID=A0A9P5HIF7_9HYPO|nr:hypothetical protein G7Z17_g1470 [Cylindrodendrum hubeiense]
MADNSSQDADPYEYLRSDTFWGLGIFILANAIWTSLQVLLLNEPENETTAKDNAQSNDLPSTGNVTSVDKASDGYCLEWAELHITSRARQILGLVICSVVLPLQLFESYAVLITTWRITDICLTIDLDFKPRILYYIMYLFTGIIFIFIWTAVLASGKCVLGLQLEYATGLYRFTPNAHPRLYRVKSWDMYDEEEEGQQGQRSDKREA